MATTVSFVVVLLLFSSVSHATNGKDVESNNDNVKTACASTPYPEMCFDYLSFMEGSKDADLRTLIGMAVYKTTMRLTGASSMASSITYDYPDMPEADYLCYETCSTELDNAKKTLYKSCTTKGGGTDWAHVNLDTVRRVLTDAKEKHNDWTCDKCTHGKYEKVDVISKGSEVQKLMAILAALLDRAHK
ncbi:hypothetical protein ZWY2020_011717 [Hordeum vulgare]|nr:hypothetical protein ZWY2020_011717 [Hordeum vulgare]